LQFAAHIISTIFLLTSNLSNADVTRDRCNRKHGILSGLSITAYTVAFLFMLSETILSAVFQCSILCVKMIIIHL